MTLETVRLTNGKDRKDLERSQKQITLPAGAVRVPAQQPFHLLAAALLEPDSDDSFLSIGAFDQALPPESTLPRHLLAPLADKMMAQDPARRGAFENAVAGDKSLAADPQARLR